MRALLVVVLVLCGCRKNHDELLARLADAERRLAAQQAVAVTLNEERKALDFALLKLASEQADFPAEQVALDAIDALPIAPVAVAPALPPESLFEGAEGARLRLRIQDSEARIAELSKIVAEVGKLDAKRRHVQQRLDALRARPQP